MRNTIAHLLAPLTAPGKDQSGGATARGGGEATANGDSEKELCSGHSSGCQSNRGLRQCYLTEAEEQGRLERRWRRSSAAVSMAATWRSRPEQPEGDRVIRMGSTPPTDATNARNREEEVSPELETKSDDFGRKGGNSNSAPTCKGGSKLREG